MNGESFIVSTRHMNAVLAAFHAVHGDNFRLAHDGNEVRGADGFTRLGLRLFAMNAAALAVMRGTEPVPLFRAQVWPHGRLDAGALAPLLKACHCLRYQCTAPGIPETWPLYHDLGDVVAGLADKIACAVPEYRSAPWHVGPTLEQWRWLTG